MFAPVASSDPDAGNGPSVAFFDDDATANAPGPGFDGYRRPS